jgi:hypothetical protein
MLYVSQNDITAIMMQKVNALLWHMKIEKIKDQIVDNKLHDTLSLFIMVHKTVKQYP